MTSAEVPLRDPRDTQKFVYHETVVRKIAVVVIGTFLKAFMVMRVEGLENLPRQGACILASNHLSNFDVFPMQLALPRPLFFMGKAELFENPIMGWVFRQLGGFPVKRGARDQWALNHARKVIDKGLVLAMFPGGTRSRNRGLSVAKTGAARLPIEKEGPIVPFAHVGSDKLFTRFPHLNPVHLIVSPPIFPDNDDDPLSLTDLSPSRGWVVLGASWFVLAVPQVLLMQGGQPGALSATRVLLGWVADEDPWPWFWLKNLGWLLPLVALALLGTVALRRRGRDPLAVGAWVIRRRDWDPFPAGAWPILLGLLSIFVVANVLVFQPWDWDNHKILVYFFLAAILVVTPLLTWAWRTRSVVLRGLVIAAVLVLTLSGVLEDVWQLLGQSRYRMLDAEQVEHVSGIRAASPT